MSQSDKNLITPVQLSIERDLADLTELDDIKIKFDYMIG